MNLIPVVALALGWLVLPASDPVRSSNRRCELTPSLRDQLSGAFPGWKVVHRGDLAESDWTLFQKDHPKACPGHAPVKLYGDANSTVALSLTRTGRGRLVLAREHSPQRWQFEVLEDGDEAGVLWAVGPGKYQDVHDGRQLNVVNEGLVWCGYESWAILYSVVAGKIDKIWLAD
jgi:hypothetical protein